ncbi:ABC transporter ATP-binding protein [Methylobrevis albus]|uniref:ABC transporter ATP-binding protein n=1 Tax=Methylobrevis albus TaxID=2793297 RepID=A0A931I0Y6_9HYPH|nr:ABC transporter ATP-binding protein [Methylobrevis albus]MBH0236961.1 ABC transporter ATP-binding protein [Methylobrevis albus]
MVVTDTRQDGAPRAAWQEMADGGDGWPIIRRIARNHVAPRWKQLAVAMVAMAFVAVTTGALPFLLQIAADRIFIGKETAVLWTLPGVIIAVMALRSFAEYFGRLTEASIGNGIVSDLRKLLFEKLVSADLGFLQRTHSAAFVSVFANDTQIVNNAAAQTLTSIAKNLLQSIALAVAMLVMDPVLGLIVLAAVPLAVVLIGRQRKQMRSSVHRTLRGAGDLSSLVSQTLTGIRVVKAYGQEAAEAARAGTVIDRTLAAILQTAKSRAVSGPVTEGLSGIGFAAAIFYGGWQGIYGNLTLGEFMGFMAAALLVYQPLKALASLQNVLLEGLIAARRVFSILDEPARITEVAGARPLAVSAGNIRFEDVVFAYEPGRPVIDGVTIDIPAGCKVALVGPSGSGKSTFLNLVLRFYDPDSGRITIDGQDVRTATISSVRRASALLTQDPVLFDDTIRANIAYGAPEADDAAVVAAAQAANAEEFITPLPQGYATRVGEAGGLLSGGQKQRIAFARAMLRGAPILLLDEPTSALDATSEAKVQETLDTMFEGRTVLMIAHRLSTVKRADMILVFDRGRIVETGTHDSLVAAGGLYDRLHRTQLAGGEPAAN